MSYAQNNLFNAIDVMHVSEKSSTQASENNCYVFKVAKDASKSVIKDAVSRYFDVDVLSVRTLIRKNKIKGRAHRSTRSLASKNTKFSVTKLAYVSLAKGSTIDFTSEQTGEVK